MRTPFRALLGFAAVLTSLSAVADSPWLISGGHRLTWQNRPYTPVGLRIDGTSDAINKAASQGFKEVCVDLPVGGDGWAEAFAALQKQEMSFLVSINSLANFADGYNVEPEGFRVTEFKEGKPISLSIPGATSVLAVLAASRDGEILKVTRVKTPGGQFFLDMPMPSEDDAILILYPRMQSPSLPDFYEGFDKQRDRLLQTLRSMKLTTGLRGIVDPIGAVVKLPPPDVHFVPSSPYFQLELARALESKYRSVETAEQSWSMRSSNIDTFEKMARLVPMWSGERGLLNLWDPTTDTLYPLDNRRSLVWDDIQEVINTTARTRMRSLTEAVHTIVQVPVIQEWAGWSIPYEGGEMVDGVGMQTQGTSPSMILEGASRAASTILRWKKPGWLLATRVNLDDAKPGAVAGVAEDLISVGARGIFAQTDDPEVRKALVDVAKKYRSGGISDDPVRAFYFPEDATFPAEPQRMPGGVWWLPAPYSGNRTELGTRVLGYRFNTGRGSGEQFVYWVANGTQPVRLRMSNPKNATVSSIDGTPITSKVAKDGVDVTLTTTPIVVTGVSDLPIPDIAKTELVDHFAKLIVQAGNNHVDTTQETYVFQSDAAGFDRSPGGSFAAMYTQYRILSLKLSSYTWIEGESAEAGGLGEHIFYPGCSMDSAFRMQTRLGVPGRLYKINYSILPRTEADQDVWIAAKIAPNLRKNVRVLVGTQVFSLPDTPLCPYGLGFAWYHLGVTKLGRDPALVTINIEGDSGFEFAVDTILLTPDPFDPFGVRIPDSIKYDQPKAPGKPGKR